MKIKWLLRFQNRVTLTALVATVVPFVYQFLAVIGITPSVTESTVLDLSAMAINVLIILGVVVDPTTDGVCDTDKVMRYERPRKETETVDDEEEIEPMEESEVE